MYQTGYNCDIFFYYKLSFSFFVLFFVQSVHCSTMTQLHRISSSEMGGACVFTLLQFYQYLILVLCIQTIIILGFALFFSVEIRWSDSYVFPPLQEEKQRTTAWTTAEIHQVSVQSPATVFCTFYALVTL